MTVIILHHKLKVADKCKSMSANNINSFYETIDWLNDNCNTYILTTIDIIS